MSADASAPSPATECCEACGSAEPIQMADRWLCLDCISAAGSCCPEFGAWDAWSQDEGVAPKCFTNPPPQEPPP